MNVSGVWIMIMVDFHVFISPFSPINRLRIYFKHLRHLQTRRDWSKVPAECHSVSFLLGVWKCGIILSLEVDMLVTNSPGLC